MFPIIVLGVQKCCLFCVLFFSFSFPIWKKKVSLYQIIIECFSFSDTFLCSISFLPSGLVCIIACVTIEILAELPNLKVDFFEKLYLSKYWGIWYFLLVWWRFLGEVSKEFALNQFFESHFKVFSGYLARTVLTGSQIPIKLGSNIMNLSYSPRFEY